ncbi:hypothetical protein XENORESO_012767 [Xenotaenia resolanae]|uniref:Protein kinase domain-containing protein n=1 Tax=Xenotaenia resolanae TaxID=208358 RepID=A0ABV0X9X5_9TELE
MAGNPSKADFNIQKNTVLCSKTNQYLVEDILGCGGYGQVVSCKKLGTDETVAIKVVKQSKYASGKNEMKILKAIREFKSDKSNIVCFLEHFDYQNQFCLALERLDINLHDFIKCKYFVPLDVNEIRVIAQQLLVALNVLKNMGVTHRDIKCDNIMLVDHVLQPLSVKLIDFGLSTRTYNLTNLRFKQPLSYRSPDVILDLPLDEAIDMWGLGCVLSFLYLGRHLFPSGSEYETLSVMIKLLGQPHDTLLTCAFSTDTFFKCVTGEFTHSWLLKTADEYVKDSGEQIVLRRGVYSDLNSLDDLQNMRPQAKDPFEKADLLSFIDLLKQILDINPSRRITPINGLNHEFITMKHLSGATNSPYVTTSYKKMEKHPETEPEVGESTPPGPSQSQTAEESLDSGKNKADKHSLPPVPNSDSAIRMQRRTYFGKQT